MERFDFRDVWTAMRFARFDKAIPSTPSPPGARMLFDKPPSPWHEPVNPPGKVNFRFRHHVLSMKERRAEVHTCRRRYGAIWPPIVAGAHDGLTVWLQ